MKTLTFYFGLRSPYSALGSDLMHEAAGREEYAGKVHFRVAPFSNRSQKFLDPTSNPLKLNYMMVDLPRLYAARNLPLVVPGQLDLDFSIPGRLVIAAERDGFGTACLRELSMLRWSEGRDIAETETLMEAANRAGWSTAAAEAALGDPALEEAYEEAITASETAGVFGVPFFIVSDGDNHEPFWGQDRWPMVEAALRAG